MTELVMEIIVAFHVTAGLVALPVFWIPALARKGSPLHRKAGVWFVGLMTMVAITGVPLIARFLLDGRWVSGTFLGYLLVITVTALATAWFALKLKQRPERYYGIEYRIGAVINLVAGATVLYLGISRDVTLLTLFSFISILSGIGMLRTLRREPEQRWWLQEHLGGMIGAGIAAHVAFGAFGLRRLLPEYGTFGGVIGMLPWIVPVIVGVAASIYSSRKYRVKATA